MSSATLSAELALLTFFLESVEVAVSPRRSNLTHPLAFAANRLPFPEIDSCVRWTLSYQYLNLKLETAFDYLNH